MIAGSGAVAGAAMACSWPLRAQTNPAVHRFAVGAAEITVLSDGNMSLPLGFVLPGRERAEVEALFTSQGLTLGSGHRAVGTIAPPSRPPS